MDSIRELWLRAVSPVQGFQILAERPLHLGRSLRRMLAWRVPIALVDAILVYLNLRWQLGLLQKGEGMLFSLLQAKARDSAQDWLEVLRELPALPPLGKALPWLLLSAPLGILGAWIHHAIWDHGCLWILGGLKTKRGFRVSLVAEAEALQVGALGAAVGLLGSLPILGVFLSAPLLALGIYFWVLRGFALAAYHGCAPWRGAVATLLHILLVLLCSCGLMAMMMAFIARALA